MDQYPDHGNGGSLVACLLIMLCAPECSPAELSLSHFIRKRSKADKLLVLQAQYGPLHYLDL